jgi:hypothetical protein
VKVGASAGRTAARGPEGPGERSPAPRAVYASPAASQRPA